jgi:hypothetical protein
MAEISTLFVEIVLPAVDELNVIVPVEVQTVVDVKNIDPLIATVGAVPLTNVGVSADPLKSKQVNAPVSVTV